MKLMFATAALALTAISAPAAAQSNAAAQPAQAQQPPNVKPSSKAMKPLVELQNAIKANDTANIPAKLAAAQAASTTKEDRYLVAVFQRQIAITAGDRSTETLE